MSASQPVASTSGPSQPVSSSSVASNGVDQAAIEAQAGLTAQADMHFDTKTGKWIYEAADGREMEYDEEKKSWVPVIDEQLLEAQAKAYSVQGVDESTPADVIARRDNKKRKKGEENGDSAGPSTKKPAREKPAQRNTAVYVTKLPTDRPPSVEELRETFSKAGLVLEDTEGQPRIKLYTDAATGAFNGEALIIYLNEASVELAVRLLDETELRLGQASRDGLMSVQPAKFDHKKSTEGSGDTKGRPDHQKAKAHRKAEKQRSKVTDWDDSDDEATSTALSSRFAQIVVLARMFSLAELEADPALLLDLKEDVREECESLGKVTNVVLYDVRYFLGSPCSTSYIRAQKEPDGIMTIRFADAEAAQACVKKMNGRFFSQRTIVAGIYDGKRRFRKSGKGVFDEEAEADEKQRLESFARFLEDDEES